MAVRQSVCTDLRKGFHSSFQDGLYKVRIDVAVPDGELVTSHEHHHRDSAHEDVHVPIRDAFNAMRRQLEDDARKRRGKVKRHAALMAAM